jgi:hypothetical protein
MNPASSTRSWLNFGRFSADISFLDTVDNEQAQRWTIGQAHAVAEALMASSAGLDTLAMELEVCRPEAIGLFLNYISPSNSLQTLRIEYDPFYLWQANVAYGDELQQAYQNEIENVFFVPSIVNVESPCPGARPAAFFLTTQSLRSFNGADIDATYEVAFAGCGRF